MKILAIFIVGFLLMVGKFQVHAEMLVVKKTQLLHHVEFGRRIGSIAFNHEAVEGRNLFDEVSEAEDDDENDAASGTESHRLFPGEGRPRNDNPPRRLP